MWQYASKHSTGNKSYKVEAYTNLYSSKEESKLSLKIYGELYPTIN